MAHDQDQLKEQYRAVAAKRGPLQELVMLKTAGWDGKGPKPAALIEAEANRDNADVELARLSDRFKF